MSRQDCRIWSRPPQVSVSLGSSMPQRVDTSTPDPNFVPRPVGFTAPVEAPEPHARPDLESQPEPILWEGDDA